MDGVGRQEKNSIFVGDQLEAVGKVSRRAVKLRAKVPIPFAVIDAAYRAGETGSVITLKD